MILFLDTVSLSPKFSLIENNKSIHSIHILDKNSNKISDRIFLSFNKMHNRFKLDNKIQKLIVCTGPGSYTALRVGIAFMYGLSISKKIPLLGLSSLEIMKLISSNAENKKNIFLISSLNNQNFICSFSNIKRKYIFKKVDDHFELSNFKNSNYINCISNFTFSYEKKKNLNFSKHICIDFAHVVASNFDKIIHLKKKAIIEPIYISDNKLFD